MSAHGLRVGAADVRSAGPVVIQARQSRHNDPDAGIRRQVRKTLAHYRRTGKVTDAAR